MMGLKTRPGPSPAMKKIQGKECPYCWRRKWVQIWWDSIFCEHCKFSYHIIYMP